MSKHVDMVRVAGFVAEQFAIYTTDPKRLGNFARDLLERGIEFTAYQLELKASLERVSKW
jgi:hypothetical protein